MLIASGTPAVFGLLGVRMMLTSRPSTSRPLAAATMIESRAARAGGAASSAASSYGCRLSREVVSSLMVLFILACHAKGCRPNLPTHQYTMHAAANIGMIILHPHGWAQIRGGVNSIW